MDEGFTTEEIAAIDSMRALISADPRRALVLAAGALTAIAQAQTKAQGGDPDREIVLTGHGARTITVGPAKGQ